MGGQGDGSEEFGWFERTGMSMLRPFRAFRQPLFVIMPLQLVLLVLPLGVPSVVRALGLGISLGAVMILTLLCLVPGLLFAGAISRVLSVSTAHEKALADGDIDEVRRLRRLMDGSGPPQTPLEGANRAVGDAELLYYFERWAEARDAFSRIDRAALHAVARPGVLAQQGYATAHAGQPELGLELLEKAMSEADAQRDYPIEKRWFLRARLGTVLSLAGRHEDAVSVLETLLSEDDGTSDARAWTAATFFLGQSFRASGRFDDAMACLEAASSEGSGPFATRARAALRLATSAPMRDGGRVPEALEELEALEDEREPLPAKRLPRP